MKRLKIDLWLNDEALDWSLEINGQHHEHITSEIVEALVECALIVAENSLTRAVASATQVVRPAGSMAIVRARKLSAGGTLAVLAPDKQQIASKSSRSG
jgi:hypothetical protein